MPNISIKSFSTFVSDMAMAIQGSASALTNFAVGSVLLAITQATAGVAIWLESLVMILLQTTRLSTSSGNDVDTFVNDFGMTRLPAVAATGSVTFARFTPTMQAIIAPGTTVQTADGTQSFTVIADTTQDAWNATLDAYVIPPGTASAIVTVQAVNSGTQGNVATNTITTLTSSIPYVDTVTNALAFADGENAETDAALKIRFQAWWQSLSRATQGAIINAILSVQVGVSETLMENYQYNGTYDPGYFYAVVDDGSGAPPSSFLSAVANAIEQVRPFTVAYGVFGPITLTANIAMTITVASGYVPASVYTSVQAALTAYVQALTLDESCQYAMLPGIALGVAGVAGIAGWTINGGTSDLVPGNQQRVLPGTVTVG
jgi:uncharacterized phage protein gp47/JayE